MAPWNELVLACWLNRDMPQPVVDILNYLISQSHEANPGDPEPVAVPNHPFFREDGWQTLFRFDTAYFPGEPYANLTRTDYEYGGYYDFSTRAMVRRGHILIETFLHWLAPYVQGEAIVGFTRCNESLDEIDLISFKEGEVFLNSVEVYENPPVITRHKVVPE